MSRIPPDLRYTREHEWASLGEDGKVKVGITDFAQSRLGDVVYLDLPDVGGDVTAGESMGEVESTKSVSDIYAPLSGSVTGLNAECRDNPALDLGLRGASMARQRPGPAPGVVPAARLSSHC